MKFDYAIGNPPYQDESDGDNSFAPPVYNKFLDAAYQVADKVMMVHPGRFLFNAGATPKDWNKRMLNDPHLKVVRYEPDGNIVFPGTDIKGGIAVTYRDNGKDFGCIGTFVAFDELKSVTKKVISRSDFSSLSDVIYTQTKFNLDALYTDFPGLVSVIGSDGKDRRFRNNVFEKVDAFREDSFDGSIGVHGLINNKRVQRYIDAKYVDSTHGNLAKYKVLVPRANGSGAIGEVLSTPLIGTPLIGYTQTYIGIGAFDMESEAEACLKYVKTKFARAMLGVLKCDQHNEAGVWQYVPLQDFTSASDIDWTKLVADIDRQLYAKYGLDDNEIAFIESHVKEMM